MVGSIIGWSLLGLFFAFIIWGGILTTREESAKRKNETPEQTADRHKAQKAVAQAKRNEQTVKWAAKRYGINSPQMICPHCQVKGKVSTKSVKHKKGISGGKATGALLTGGISMLGTGLSRKEDATEASCGNCGSTWSF